LGVGQQRVHAIRAGKRHRGDRAARDDQRARDGNAHPTTRGVHDALVGQKSGALILVRDVHGGSRGLFDGLHGVGGKKKREGISVSRGLVQHDHRDDRGQYLD